MGELTQKVIRDVDAAQSFEEIEDWMWMAGDLIRRSFQPDYPSYEELDGETVTQEERLQLKEAALRALTRNTDPLWVLSMLNVLRATYDRDLKQLWIQSLADSLTSLKMANGIVHTALLALRDLDEPVFEDNPSNCSIDYDRNISEANKYLKRHGILIPD